MKRVRKSLRAAGGEAGLAAEPPDAGPPARVRRQGDSTRRFSAAQKRALLDEYERGDETQDAFCARRSVSATSLANWRRALREQGASGLEPKRRPGGSRAVEPTLAHDDASDGKHDARVHASPL